MVGRRRLELGFKLFSLGRMGFMRGGLGFEGVAVIATAVRGRRERGLRYLARLVGDHGVCCALKWRMGGLGMRLWGIWRGG